MKKNGNFSDILKEVEPLNQDTTGKMVGGFAPFGGQNIQQSQTIQTVIMNGVLVGVLGYSCSCSCQCAC